MKTLFDEGDYTSCCEVDFAGKYMVLNPECLKGEYREAKYQLFFATGGFGCDPTKMGRAVFGYFVADGEDCRWCRGDFIGVAKDETVAKWKEMYPDYYRPTEE